MNATSDSNHTTQMELPRRVGRDFDHCITVLLEEIQLAAQWDRPSILLAINPSRASREKAQQALRKSLSPLAKSILSIGPGQDWTDLFQFLEQAGSPDRFIYFVEGLGRRDESFRALNLRREQIVEQRLIVVFWLTAQEGKELPAAAPDFWAFRHRVIEFGSQRGSRSQALPSGLMVWQQDNPFLFYETSAKDIVAAEELLQTLPVRDEAFVIRADATYRLAGLCWLQGETQRAITLLQEQVKDLETLGFSDLLATFLNGQAIITYDRGLYDEAVVRLKEAQVLKPADPVVFCNLAIALFATGKTAQSIKLLQRTIRWNSNFAWLWYILGHVQFASTKLEDADASFQAALELNKEIPYPRYAATACRTQMGDNVNAAASNYIHGHDLPNDRYHTLYLQTLLKGPILAFDTLHAAVEDGSLPRIFLKRDPIFNLLLGETIRDQLLTS